MVAAACGSAPRPTVPKAAGPGTTTTTAAPTTTAPTTTVPATTVPAAPTTLAPPTTSAPPTTAPGQSPPYPVDHDTVTYVDTSRPTVSRGTTVATSRTLTTLVDRPALAGRWPLVVFAHGYEVGPGPYATLLDAWAADGYVVAAPEFPLTDAAVAGADLDEDDIQQQPGDVRFVIDSITAAGGALAGDIDPARVIVAGHSDGAETALAESIAPTPPGEPAIDGALAMSVAPLNGVTSTANPPLMVTQGDADTTNPPASGHQAWAEASAPKWYVDLLGAGHLPPLEAGSPYLATIEAVSEAFFAYVVGGRTLAEAAAVEAAGNVGGVAATTPG